MFISDRNLKYDVIRLTG